MSERGTLSRLPLGDVRTSVTIESERLAFRGDTGLRGPDRAAVGSRLEAAATEPHHFLRRRFFVFRREALAEAAAL